MTQPNRDPNFENRSQNSRVTCQNWRSPFFPAKEIVTFGTYTSKYVGELVGVFSPVNHWGLYQGWKQTSICLQVILHTSHQIRNSLKSTKSVLTQIYMKQTHKHKIFEELVPFVLPLFKKKKKHIRLGQAGIVDHSIDLSIPDFFKV